MTESKKEKRHYKTRPAFVVVSVNPDGTVDAVYNSAAEAAKDLNFDKSTINRYCRTGKIGMGKKWFYEEDFRKAYMNCEFEKLRFTLPDDYDPKRRYFHKGHQHGNGWERKSEAHKEWMRRTGRELVRQINKRGLNVKSAHKQRKPVVCITDGREFPSIHHAAEYYGLSDSHVRSAIHRVGSTRKLKFRLKSQLEKIKEVI